MKNDEKSSWINSSIKILKQFLENSWNAFN